MTGGYLDGKGGGRLHRVVLVGMAFRVAHAAPGQQAAAPAPPAVQRPVEELGTGESIGYLGRELWFEARRRLNLTSEEEERRQREADRRYRL